MRTYSSTARRPHPLPYSGAAILGVVALVAGLIAVTALAPNRTLPASSLGCPQFVTAPSSQMAFCDTFSTAYPSNDTRAGDMNGVL
ncbi:MAG: hypothetical protein ACRDYY_04400, partial [Acidimicrobiales bacterium]